MNSLKSIKYILIVILVIISTNAFSQRKIKKLDIREEGYNIDISYVPIKDILHHNGLDITVTPVSANDLNSNFLKESGLNGKFEYSYYDSSRESYFLRKKRKNNKKTDYDYLMEGVTWLIDQEIITQPESFELERQIRNYINDKPLDEDLESERIITANPYYFDSKYLSVFKVEISNTTGSSIAFKSDFSISSGNTLYNPLDASYISDELRVNGLLNTKKSLILERYNLPMELSIPPSSKILKYFATIPINPDNEKLQMHLQNTTETLEWSIQKEKIEYDNLYRYFEFDVYWKLNGIGSEDAVLFQILKTNDSDIHLVDEKLFIAETDIDKEFEVFTFAMNKSYLYYLRSGILKGSDYIIKEKQKRKKVYLDLNYISDLKKTDKK